MSVRILAIIAAIFFTTQSAFALTLDADNNIEDTNLTNAVADTSGLPGPYNIQTDPYFWGASFQSSDSAGTAVFEFFNDGSTAQNVGVTIGTVLQSAFGFFTGGVTASWDGGESVFVPQSTSGSSFVIKTSILGGNSDTLRIAFGDPDGIGRADIDLIVASIPLPASLLLLLTGLLGLGFLGRFRSRASSAATA